MTTDAKLKAKDFKSDQDVRWCPGCGDYAILSCVQGVMAELGVSKENTVFVSGIGCSSRFPYYMDTYGFHSIHGRAPAVATGIKVANPDLSVWIVTGDGDALSIGGNHLIHLLRRNVNIKVLLFNNEIYGLTKGQYSPTSRQGLRTKATPFGSIDHSFNPISLSLGAGASFVARTVDTNLKHMREILLQAAAHKGTCFIEIFQNCVIFNDKVFDEVADKQVRNDRLVTLAPGEKVVYGSDGDKGLRLNGFDLEQCSADEAMVWDASTASAAPAMLFADIDRASDLPTPIGIFRKVERSVFENDVYRQMDQVTSNKGPGDLKSLIYTGDMWNVD
ncbi:MAG: 2-oxoacid:ferredoxin oxidoreductase subunit beta [Planctomycetes bacterium]|jgi:2-oxoglutarate ferredoxin oxidoreductase subunit beta|nr:2-oxoacid:ferredoxin oxidoreductase subunit beta [Planctomycetota bacterium]